VAHTWFKTERDSWPEPAAFDVIVLKPGVHAPAEFSACPDLTIQGQPGAIIEGSLTPRGGEDDASLRFHDGCHRLRILGPLEIRGSAGRGLSVTKADDVTIRGLESHSHGIEAVFVSNCPRANLSNLYCHDSHDTGATSPDRQHGLYLSGQAEDTTLTGLYCERVTGSGLQINGASLGFIITGLHARQMIFKQCGSGGTPPLSLMALHESTIEEFCIADVPSDRWAVLFSDRRGAAFSCQLNTFRTFSVPTGSRAAEEEGSGGNLYSPGAGWSPGDAPQPIPVPAPTPPPSPDPLSLAVVAMDRTLAAKRLARKAVLASWAKVKACLK
jgi:hypothetical protein